MELTTMGWLFMMAGFIPWRIAQREMTKGKGRRRQRWTTLTVQATFWQVQIERRPQGLTWQFTLPLIIWLKTAIWAALRDLIQG
ncbi:MAG: hypothetical protein R3C14_52470 [Caldilineaceae bacterium]